MVTDAQKVSREILAFYKRKNQYLARICFTDFDWNQNWEEIKDHPEHDVSWMYYVFIACPEQEAFGPFMNVAGARWQAYRCLVESIVAKVRKTKRAVLASIIWNAPEGFELLNAKPVDFALSRYRTFDQLKEGRDVLYRLAALALLAEIRQMTQASDD